MGLVVVLMFFSDPRKNRIIKVDEVKATEVRSLFEPTMKSANLSRDIIYKQLTTDQNYGHILIDLIYRVMPLRVELAGIKQAKEKIREKIANTIPGKKKEIQSYPIGGYLPAAFKREFDFQRREDFSKLFVCRCVADQTIGGGDKNRGALTAGYMFGEISPSWHKVTCKAREIITMLNYYQCSTVKLPDSKGYGTNLIRTLIRNGVSVIHREGTGIQKDTTVGFYRITIMDCVEIINDPFPDVKFEGGLINWHSEKYEDEKFIFFDKAPSIRLTLTTLKKELLMDIENETFGYFPSLYPHMCKVWIATKGGVKFEDAHFNRLLLAIWARVAFPFSRRPFFVDDPCRKFFTEKLYLPKVVKKDTDSLRSYVVEQTPNFAQDLDLNDIESVYGSVDYVEIIEKELDFVAIRLDELRRCKDDNTAMMMVMRITQGQGFEKDSDQYFDDINFSRVYQMCQDATQNYDVKGDNSVFQSDDEEVDVKKGTDPDNVDQENELLDLIARQTDEIQSTVSVDVKDKVKKK